MSSGALEYYAATKSLFSTSNMPFALAAMKDNGWNVLGTHIDHRSESLQSVLPELPAGTAPTVIVLVSQPDAVMGVACIGTLFCGPCRATKLMAFAAKY